MLGAFYAFAGRSFVTSTRSRDRRRGASGTVAGPAERTGSGRQLNKLLDLTVARVFT
jgi:hypothetical protein